MPEQFARFVAKQESPGILLIPSRGPIGSAIEGLLIVWLTWTNEANTIKNWERHQVTPKEAEDVFFNEPFVVRGDVQHSRAEKRYYALGQTGAGRRLFVVFTIRRKLVRVISVRGMNKHETETIRRHEKNS